MSGVSRTPTEALGSQVEFMRNAENVRQTDSGGLTASRSAPGARVMTAAEARIAVDQLSRATVTPRELAVAVNSLPGLSASEKAMLLAALPAGAAEGSTDITSDARGHVTPQGAQTFLETFVSQSHDGKGVTMESEPTIGKGRNFSLQPDGPGSAPASFDAGRASRAINFLSESGHATRAQLTAAIANASISDADKALLRAALQNNHSIS